VTAGEHGGGDDDGFADGRLGREPPSVDDGSDGFDDHVGRMRSRKWHGLVVRWHTEALGVVRFVEIRLTLSRAGTGEHHL
jgi:hypothetical protein